LTKLSRASAVGTISFVSLVVSPLTISVFSLVLSPISESQGWSISQVSVAPAMFYLVSGFTSLLIGRLTEKFKSGNLLAVLLAVCGISSLFMGEINQLWQLYLIVGIIFPFGSAGGILVVISVMMTKFLGRKQGSGLNLIAIGLPIGQLFSIPLFGLLLVSQGWRFVYVPVGIAILVLSVIVYFVCKEPTGVQIDEQRGVSAVLEKADKQIQPSLTFYRALSSKSFLLFSVSYFACGFTDFVVTVHLPSFALSQHFFQQSGAYSLAIIGGANVLGLLLTGKISDRAGPKKTLAWTYGIRLFSMIYLTFFLNGVDSLYLFSFLFGLTFFTTAPLTANLVRTSFGKGLMGSIYGALGLVHSVGGALGAFAGGYIFDLTGSYFVAFLAGSLILLAGTICSFAVGFGLVRTREEETIRTY